MLASVAAAALVVDTATLAWLLATGRGGRSVREWYATLGTGAYAMDVLSLIIGVAVGVLAAPDSLVGQLGVVLALQLTHDLLFGLFVAAYPVAPLMQLFKRYADEMGAWILLTDALMLTATLALAHLLHARVAPNSQLLLGAVAAYIGLLLTYSVKK